MTQQEVMDILDKHKDRWYTAIELMEILNISQGSVTNNCRRLRGYGLIDCKYDGKKYLYRHRKLELK